MASTAPIEKFGAISTPTSGCSPSSCSRRASFSSSHPVVPTTQWMPGSTPKRTLSSEAAGTVRSIRTSACASTSPCRLSL